MSLQDETNVENGLMLTLNMNGSESGNGIDNKEVLMPLRAFIYLFRTEGAGTLNILLRSLLWFRSMKGGFTKHYRKNNKDVE